MGTGRDMDAAWREANRANWDERVAVHLAAYDLAPLRAGRGRLTDIEQAELGCVRGRRVLHLQCHIGSDTLALAQQGAKVTGLDFSAPAIAAACGLADELGLADRARFVVSDVYAAPAALAEPAGFDLVFANWGTLCWVPDVARWMRVAAHFLRPGGALYLIDGHPAALVFDDGPEGAAWQPRFFAPYFHQGPLVIDDARDYADAKARLLNARTHQFVHTLGAIVQAALDAGLALAFLHEHDRVAWRMFPCLVPAGGGLHRWPDRPWLPLAYSLRAVKPDAVRPGGAGAR